MKNKFKILALSVASVMGLGFFSSANGAVIVTFDLRQSGTGAKNIEITTPGQAITFDVIAQVTNNDADHTNDGVTSASLKFLSTEDASAALQGNFSNALRN